MQIATENKTEGQGVGRFGALQIGQVVRIETAAYDKAISRYTRTAVEYNEVVEFIQTNHRNPSRYNPEERYKYCNCLKHTKKQFNAGELKPERVGLYEKLLALAEENKHVNQWK